MLLVVAALLLVLLTPARVVLRIAGDVASGVEIAVTWRLLVLHGERRRRLTLAPATVRNAVTPEPPPRLATAAPSPAAATQPAATEPPARRTVRSTAVRDRLADLERTIALVQRLVERKAVRVASVRGWLEFALGDVAETGRMFGFACALATLIDPEGRLELQPRWDTEDWLAADLAVEARVQPLRTLLLVGDARRARRASARPGAAAHGGDGAPLAA